MTSIPWENIENGYQGFEDLANEYVKLVFTSYKWNPTKKSRDNNHDGYAIVTCFSHKAGSYEVWMEAKYSTSKSYLTRYRLDSTIVSAIIEQNIRQLYFVTNIEIADYVRQAIRTALTNALHIQQGDVFFCTKKNLEVWLCLPENSETLQTYFPGLKVEDVCVDSDLQLIDQPGFYKYTKHQLTYQAPLRKLYESELYLLYFRLYSHVTKEVNITSSSKYFRILYPGKPVILQPRSNEVALIVKCKPTDKQTDAFLVGNQTISLDTVSVCKNPEIKVSIHSQQEHLKVIRNSLYSFLRQKKSVIHLAWGVPYSGKSYAIREILSDKKLYDEDVLFYTFDMDRYGNSIKLLDLCLRIYFYLFDPKEIDENYLSEINLKYDYIPHFIKELVRYKEDEHSLLKAMAGLKEKVAFSQSMCVTRKIIFLDEAEHLSPEQARFLKKILYELYVSETPVFCLLAGRSRFWLDIHGLPNVITHHFRTDFNDFQQTLQKNKIEASSSFLFLVHTRIKKFPDLLNFIKYIKINKKGTYDEVKLTEMIYRFEKEDHYKEYIKKIFSEIELNKPEESNVLHLVYFTLSGFPLEEIKETQHRKAVEYLVDQELLKVSLGRLFPYNEIYRKVFTSCYSTRENPLVEYYRDSLVKEEILRYYISRQAPEYSLKRVQEIVEGYGKKQHFLMVDYLLYPLFHADHLYDFYKNDPYFYQLKFYHIYALSNIDPDFNTTKAYVGLYLQLSCLDSDCIEILKFNIFAEIVNFTFVDLQIEDTSCYIQEFRSLYEKYCTANQNQERKTISFLLVDEIEILTYAMIDQYELARQLYQDALEKCRTCNNEIKEGIIMQRYARSLFHNDTSQALLMLEEAYKLLNGSTDKKWAALCNMDIQHVKKLLGKLPFTDLQKETNLPEENFATTFKIYLRYQMAYELYGGNTTRFRELFFEYQALRQPHSNRSKGIDYLLEAAYYYIKKEYAKSAEKLILQSAVFSGLGMSYKNIISHNLSLVQTPEISRECMLRFYTTGKLEENTFYLDPRLW